MHLNNLKNSNSIHLLQQLDVIVNLNVILGSYKSFEEKKAELINELATRRDCHAELDEEGPISPR